MPADREQLVILLEAKVADLEKGMRRAAQAVDKRMKEIEGAAKRGEATIERATARISAAFAGIGSRLKGGAAGILAGFGLDQARQAVAELAKVGDVASRLGITTERLQELTFAARQFGLDFNSVADTLTEFSIRLGEATKGEGDLYELLKANNVALRDARGNMRPFNDLLNDFADLVRDAGSAAERSAILSAAFSDEGAKYAGVFTRGAAGLRAAADEAHRLGEVLDESAIRRAKELDVEFSRATAQIEAGFKRVVIAVADAGKAVGESDWFTSLGAYLEKTWAGAKREWKEIGEAFDGTARDMAGDVSTFSRDGSEAFRQFTDSAISDSHRLGAAMRGVLDGMLQGIAALPKGDRIASPVPAPAGGGGRWDQAFDQFAPTATPRPKPPPPRRTILPGGGGPSDAEKVADAIERVTKELAHEEAQLGRTSLEQRIYNELKAAGTTLETTAGKAIAATVTRIHEQEKAIERAKEVTEEWNRAMESLQDQGLDTAIDALFGRTRDWRDQLEQIIRTVLPALIKQLQTAASIQPGGGGGNNWLSALASAFITSAGGGGMSGMSTGAGAGGVASSIPTAMSARAINAQVAGITAAAQHVGPAAAMAAAGARPVTINVENRNGSAVQAQQRSTPQGDIIEMVIDQVDGAMANGRFDRTMGARYSARPATRKIGR